MYKIYKIQTAPYYKEYIAIICAKDEARAKQIVKQIAPFNKFYDIDLLIKELPLLPKEEIERIICSNNYEGE